MHPKPASTSVKIHDIIQNRWSPRAIDPNKPVSHDDLLALLEAARWAPSCFNDQPWRFIVCDKSADLASWETAFDTLMDKNRLWAKNAPVLILSVAMANFNHNGKPNRFGMYDTGAASVSLALQASALGLVVHQMGGYDADKARAAFGLPDDCTPMAMMALGYQAEADSLDEDFKAAELAERARASLGQRFYAGKWGVGIA
ncbi:nitroreductase family protein [Methylovulum miyakonense]|uniref:nitroreductase family protein n=1 Tax=Methylovulum miyakonense TaxID=645578 RepID=UPI0003801628|nr:nitroreductase family protein [Methylovulum miyakonense]